jgi:hypothetical protein
MPGEPGAIDERGIRQRNEQNATRMEKLMPKTTIDLKGMERLIIWEDQQQMFKSFHIGGKGKCKDLARCPVKHFSGIIGSEIRARQRIIRKLEQPGKERDARTKTSGAIQK